MGMDESLRMNLSAGLADGLDKQIVAGTNGLLTATNLANHAAGAVTSFDSYLKELAYGRVDGRYAGTAGDLRVVMGSGTYAHAGASYRKQLRGPDRARPAHGNHRGRSGLLARSGRRGEQAERGHPPRHGA